MVFLIKDPFLALANPSEHSFFTYIDKDSIISQSMFKNLISNVIHYIQTHDTQQDIISLFKKDGIKITKVKSKVNFKYNVQLEQKYTFNYIVNN